MVWETVGCFNEQTKATQYLQAKEIKELEERAHAQQAQVPFFPSNWPLLVVREALAPPRFNELIPQTYLKGDTFAKLYFFGYLCEISRGLRILISKMT